MHDRDTLVNIRTKTYVGLSVLSTPATVDEWLWNRVSDARTSGSEPAMTLADAVHLHVAANALVWQAFDYVGIGDWVGSDGVQMGADCGRA